MPFYAGCENYRSPPVLTFKPGLTLGLISSGMLLVSEDQSVIDVEQFVKKEQEQAQGRLFVQGCQLGHARRPAVRCGLHRVCVTSTLMNG